MKCFTSDTQFKFYSDRKNFVSDAKSIKWDEDIPGSNDHNPSGFYNLNGPNDYIGNVAVGNRYYGFYFVNDWRVRHEVSSYFSF